jgi:uncharacterized membrane protein YhiD involved in acid resistance
MDHIVLSTIPFSHILQSVLIAFVCGLLVSFSYKLAYKGPAYSRTFARSMIILSMITAVMIMVIGSSLARAFGLVGALSIIRFRTAVKDVQDIVYIFFALSAGFATGTGLYGVAVGGTVLIGTAGVILSRTQNGFDSSRGFLLQLVMTDSPEDKTSHVPILAEHCSNHRLLNVRSSAGMGTMELSFYIQLRRQTSCKELVSALQHIEGVRNVSLLQEDEPL